MRYALIWLALLCGAVSAWAVNPEVRISQYGHTAWRVQDGAIAPGYTIAQTTDGYLWIGTTEGLMHFDGVRFVRWQPPSGQNLPGMHFTALFGSRDGSLWIGTTRGLSRWKDGQLRTYTDMDHPASIAEIIEDNYGTIWFTRYGRYAREGPLCGISTDTLQCFGKKDGIPVGYALGLSRDSAGDLWFGSSVLCRWKPGSPATTFLGDADKLAKGHQVTDVAVSPSGAAWASLDGTGRELGVRYYSKGKWTSYFVPGFDGSKILSQTLHLDRQGSLWVGTENDGIYRIHGDVADHYGVPDGLSGNVVGFIFEDKEGNIWVRTDGGLDMFRDTPIVNYTTRQGLSNGDLRSVLVLRDGSVWIATEAAIDVLEKKGDSTVISRRELPGHKLTSMLEDHSGAVWVGVDNKLMVYKNGQFREVLRRNGQPFAGVGEVTAIAEDINHTIRVLTSQGQLFSVVSGNVQEQVSVNRQLGHQEYLATDSDGGVWIGAERGAISYYRDGHLRTIPLTDSEGPLHIGGLFVDTDNSVLVSTERGLYRLKDSQRSDFSSNNGLPCPAVCSALRDNNGAFWIFTQCGFVKISRAEWATWVEKPHRQVPVIILDALDGAQAGMGSPAQPSSFKAPDGRLWFVTGVAAQVMDPDHLYNNTPPPPVYVEGIVADHKVLPARSGLQIPALTRDVQIDYTALSFSVPQKVRFRYLLEGHDREWQDAGTRRQAFYTDLAPGTYRFQVTACNRHGVWNEQGATLGFTVLPAWYQTTWFRVSCAAAFLLLLGAFYQMRIEQLARQFNVRLEERVSERTRMARELHDTFLQTLQGSKLVADDALENVNDPIRTRHALEQLSQWLAKAMKEGRAALHSLRISITETNDLAAAFRRALEDCHRETSMETAFSVAGDVRDMHPFVRDEVYRIGYEAIRNASSHSEGSCVVVALDYGNDLSLQIRDNGVGIDPAIVETGKGGHFGLRGMRERASRIGARITIASSANSGTEVRVVVPGRVVFQKPPVSPIGKGKTVLKRMLRETLLLVLVSVFSHL